MNLVILSGHTGGDPQIVNFEGGGSLARIPLATTYRYKNKDTNETITQTEWHNLVFSRKGMVTLVDKYVKKGDRIGVTGAIRTRKWQDKDGNNRYSTEIVVNEIEFQTKKDNSTGAVLEDNTPPPENNDDLPF